jgi:hypothetical protein
MTILHVYTSTYNDLYMIQFFVRHYAQFASKIFVYDDDSTDGTREFLESMAPLVEIKDPGFTGLDQLKLQAMRSNEYKIHSRGLADWCLVGDSDEFHYHPNLLARLGELKASHFSAVVTHGWNMFSKERPQGPGQMTSYVRTGIRDPMYDRVIFRPEIDITIGIGLHGFTLTGDDGSVNFREFQMAGQKVLTSPPEVREQYRVLESDPEFMMLHYKYLGREHVIERHDRVWNRLSANDKAHNWGIHTNPNWGAYYGLSWYDEKLKEARPCL